MPAMPTQHAQSRDGVLLRSGSQARVDSGSAPTYAASQEGCVEVAKALLAPWASMRARRLMWASASQAMHSGCALRFAASRWGDVEVAKERWRARARY